MAVKKKSILDMAVGRINLTQKVIFAKNLSLMLKSGLSIVEAIDIASDQAGGKLKKVLAGVLASIESGHSLADSFARYPRVFSGVFIDVTRAGEKSGNLEGNLANIAIHLQKEQNLTAKIKGAMFYPIIVLIAAFFLGLAVAFFILPKITPLFEGLKVELPWTTRSLIAFSNLVREDGVILFVGLAVAVAFFLWLIKRKFSRPVTHWILLKIPLISKIFYQTNLARFCRTLATMLKSGINIDEALDIVKNTVGNYYYRQSIAKTAKSVGRGSKISVALDKFPKLYPKIVSRMVKVGEKSGNLEENLFYLAKFYEDEVDNTTKSLSTIIEPALLMFIGLAVAFLALSIITPIYQITGNIRR